MKVKNMLQRENKGLKKNVDVLEEYLRVSHKLITILSDRLEEVDPEFLKGDTVDLEQLQEINRNQLEHVFVLQKDYLPSGSEVIDIYSDYIIASLAKDRLEMSDDVPEHFKYQVVEKELLI